MKTVFASIGNSDDALPQHEWSAYLEDFREIMRLHADTTYGVWASDTGAAFQNACCCISTRKPIALRIELASLRKRYRQQAVAFTECLPDTTEML